MTTAPEPRTIVWRVVLPVGLALSASAVAGWWLYALAGDYTHDAVRAFLKHWFWVATPGVGMATLCWAARRLRTLSLVLGMGCVAVAVFGFYGMAWTLSVSPTQRENAAWFTLYAPLIGWCVAAPFLLVATGVWFVNLRQYRRARWRDVTTRGGAWLPREEGDGGRD